MILVMPGALTASNVPGHLKGRKLCLMDSVEMHLDMMPNKGDMAQGYRVLQDTE